MKRCFAGILMLILLAAPCLNDPASAAGKTADNITARCGFRVSSNAEDKGLLHDEEYDTAWTAAKASEQSIEITLPEDHSASGVYVMWNTVPKEWSLEAMADDDGWQTVGIGAKSSFLNAYVPLSAGLSKLRINTTRGWKCSVAEIAVYGPGNLPEDVQVWLPPPEKADLMVVSAHPDDEHIYFGGTLPYYAGELGKHTTVVYMTSSPIIRKFEALNGLWKVGVREYPVFLPLANKYSSTVEDAAEIWNGVDNTVGLVVEQFRRFRPDVVVTHDLDGEYGHGAHKFTALAVTKAVKSAADDAKYASSAREYGRWQVKKCYLHLYGKNKVRMDWRRKLMRFGGKTALQMAQAGYDLHVSQHFRERPVLDSGPDDNSLFGLFCSSVGPDVGKDDFFENVMPEPTATPSPSPTPILVVIAGSPTPQPTPEPTPESVEAAMSVPAGMRVTADSELALRVFLSFGAIAFLTFLLLAYWRSEKRRPGHCKPRGATEFRFHGKLTGPARSLEHKPCGDLHDHTGVPPV